jgi:hypothetical protein
LCRATTLSDETDSLRKTNPNRGTAVTENVASR